MQKITKIVGLSFEGGGGKNFFYPNISPNFRVREPKFFVPLVIWETHLCFEFQDHVPKIVVRGDDRRNQKIRIFWKNGNISNLVTGETAKRKQILNTACCSAIKYKILLLLTCS